MEHGNASKGLSIYKQQSFLLTAFSLGTLSVVPAALHHCNRGRLKFMLTFVISIPPDGIYGAPKRL